MERECACAPLPFHVPQAQAHTAKEICAGLFGGRTAIVGNVNRVTELLQGTPQQVAASAQRCIDQAGAGGGFLLGSGCIVPRFTPLENLQAMVETAHSQPYPLSTH